MTLEDVKAFLEQDTDEIRAYKETLIPTNVIFADKLAEYLGTDDGKKIIQPMMDRRAQEAVATRDKVWEKDKLEPEVRKRLAVEMLKIHPEESPLEKKIRELEEANLNEKAERAKDNLKRHIVEKAAEMKVEPFFLKDYLPGSEEEGELFLKNIQEHEKKVREEVINELIAAKKFIPNSGNQKERKIDQHSLTMAEAIKLEQEGKLDNPD